MKSRPAKLLREQSQAAFRQRFKRPALVLIIVLVVVAMLSLGAYAFTDLMLTHREAADLTGKQLQTRLLVDSGVDYTKMFLAQTAAAQTEAGGVYDNPERFKGVTVIEDEDPQFSAGFAVLAPNLDSEGNYEGVRHGLENESTKLNLNTLVIADRTQPGAGRKLLLALPDMTEEIADAILDWLDPDSENRDYGAENDHYSGMDPPYACKNGPVETVEELLKVRGVTPRLLYGVDVNRNGALDPAETADGGDQPEPASVRGWSAYLTLFSQEANLNPNGQPRVYLNENDLNKLNTSLTAVLPPDWVTFIIAYRQFGPYRGTDPGQQGASGTLNLTQQARLPISQVLDLVGAKVSVTFSGAAQATILASPFGDGIASGVTLPVLMDNVTVTPSKTIPGRININQAPVVILRGIPGMDDDLVGQILQLRNADATDKKPGRRHETWLMTEGVVTLDQMRTLMPYITCSGNVYRGQVVGYFHGGSAASRAEVIFDASTTDPRLLFWRNISDLGRGYAVETLGVGYSERDSASTNSNTGN